MYPILDARPLAPDVSLVRIRAPRIARKRRAGQFVMLRVHDHGERIPLTIADSDPERGCITLVVQGVGKTTRLLNGLVAGDCVLDVVGPLGRPSEVDLFGTACVVGGGVGAAIAYPTAVALKQAGNRVVSILGARRAELLLLDDEIGAASEPDSLRRASAGLGSAWPSKARQAATPGVRCDAQRRFRQAWGFLKGVRRSTPLLDEGCADSTPSRPTAVCGRVTAGSAAAPRPATPRGSPGGRSR